MSSSVLPNPPPQRPTFAWRIGSSAVMGVTGVLSKTFLYGLNEIEVIGLDRFVDLLDSRKDPAKRERGLITVSNHLSVIDDPLMWGVLPLRILFTPTDLRWGLGAHDICFKNKFLSTFFSLGQTLPTHRLQHSPHGGLFQPTMTQAIRLLSSPPFAPQEPPSPSPSPSPSSPAPSDPFTDAALTYTTTGAAADTVPAPSAYPASNRHAWVHVFPEAMVHQAPAASPLSMRYFKWGLARLVLEAEPLPDLVPVFLDGTHRVMPEARPWPRFLPRPRQRLRLAFGDRVDAERLFGDLRARWRVLVARAREHETPSGGGRGGAQGPPPAHDALGEVASEELRYGREAQELRVEVALRMRQEMLKLRRSLGYPEEDEKFAFAETWATDPSARKYRSPVDDSIIKKE